MHDLVYASVNLIVCNFDRRTLILAIASILLLKRIEEHNQIEVFHTKFNRKFGMEPPCAIYF